MTPVADQVVRLASRAGVAVDDALGGKLAAYLGLLAKWNETLNLTALQLNPPSDEAVRRLVVEPLAVAPFIPAGLSTALDVGSGGGSPALPLKMVRPEIRFVLVESKSRKCAFLREAVRHLELEGVQVANSRFEDLGGTEPTARVDLVTVRAVRLDDDFWTNLRAVLPPGGSVLLFGTVSASAPWPSDFEELQSVDIADTDARVRLGTRTL